MEARVEGLPPSQLGQHVCTKLQQPPKQPRLKDILSFKACEAAQHRMEEGSLTSSVAKTPKMHPADLSRISQEVHGPGRQISPSAQHFSSTNGAGT